MKHIHSHLNNQEGSALIVSMMVMVAVTILGLMALSTSSIELRTSRNEREIRENFYLAEGAAMEAVQRLENMPGIDLEDKMANWQASIDPNVDMRDAATWDVSGDADDNGMTTPLDPQTYFSAVEWGVAAGSSMDVSKSRLYEWHIYGYSTRNQGDNMVEIGYRLRY